MPKDSKDRSSAANGRSRHQCSATTAAENLIHRNFNTTRFQNFAIILGAYGIALNYVTLMNMIKPARVLCVEDDRTIRENISEALRDAGFEVLEAENGSEAMDILTDRTAVDVLFTDVKMPGALDGVDLVNSVRADQPELPVLITSGYASGLSERLLGVLPPALFITKPYSLANIVQVLKMLTAKDA